MAGGEDIILDSIADGVFTVDRSWRITSFNRAAERITGVSREDAIGARCCDVFRSSICETDCALRHTLESGESIVNKPVEIVDADGRRLSISVSTAILRDEEGNVLGGAETFRDLSAVEALRKELEGRYSFHDMVSRSHRLQEIFALLPDVAHSESTVLIEGESGTGKELLARAIHDLSPRSAGPLVTVNCGALPDSLLESELFGHVRGAFTDAHKDKPGRFQRAEGGTIFLDEIGDISQAMQVRLLRVLQERVFEPLGGSTPVRADVRVIAATNRRLEELVEAGRFRRDLYYRVNVIRIELPPLRERKEDIPLLVDHFIARNNRLHGRNVAGVSQEVQAALMAHDFPGNVRELQNIIERAFVLCREGPIESRHLAGQLAPAGGGLPEAGGGTLREMERVFIAAALRRNDGSRNRTAAELGIHRSTLRRKIKEYGLEE